MTSSNPTPTGIFSILEKNRYHYSNLYGGAPMPFMQRVTNSGVAMHAGDLPGYPASHGCIRLPYSFARSLFGITDVGARVIISNEDLTPAEFNSPRLIAPLPPDTTAQNGADGPVPTTASGTQSEFSNYRRQPRRRRGCRPAAHPRLGRRRARRRAQPARLGHHRGGERQARPPTTRPRQRPPPCRTPRSSSARSATRRAA